MVSLQSCTPNALPGQPIKSKKATKGTKHIGDTENGRTNRRTKERRTKERITTEGREQASYSLEDLVHVMEYLVLSRYKSAPSRAQNWLYIP